jgi:hypothetical protein
MLYVLRYEAKDARCRAPSDLFFFVLVLQLYQIENLTQGGKSFASFV